MLCNCNNYLIRKLSVRGNYLMIETDKLFVVHRSEIKKMSTKKATCHHVCDVEYLYITTPYQEIAVFMKDKTYNELVHHILDIFYPKETYTEVFEQSYEEPFYD